MKKASLIAGAAVGMAAFSVAPSFAQGGPFADVPTDHWAYAAVDKLQKKGVVIGYPDGTYGGKRAMTRYEFAVAIARLLDSMGPGGTQPDLSGYVKQSDLDQYAKKSDLPNMGDVDALRKLVKEFQPELVTLGVDLDAVKKRLDALDARVKALEDDAKRIKITGNLNVYSVSNELKQKNTIAPGTFGRKNEFDSNARKTSSFIDYNGYVISPGVGHDKGFLGSSYIFHDLDLNIQGRLTEKASAEITLNVGNYLNYLGSIPQTVGSRVDTGPSPNRAYLGQKASRDEDISVYKAVVNANLGPVKVTIGRNPFQLTPYTLKSQDVDLYHDNDKTDMGNIPLDGITGTVKIGSVSLTGFANKADPIKYVSNINNQFANQRGDGAVGSPNQASFTQYGVWAGARTGAYGGPLRARSNQVTAVNGLTYLTGNRPVGNRISPFTNGAMFVEQIGGGRGTVTLFNKLNIGGTYFSTGGTTANTDPQTFQDTLSRVDVYGGDASIKIGPVLLSGEYSKSDSYGQEETGGSDKKLISKDNQAYDVSGKVSIGVVDLVGGYRDIGPYFAAPGNWGGFGTVVNPVDIKGYYINGTARIAKSFSLFGGYQDYEGTGKAENNGGLSKDDKFKNITGGGTITFGQAHTLGAKYDQVEYRVRNANNSGRVSPKESYTDIFYGYKFTTSASLKIGYQIVKWDDKGSGFDTVNGDGNVIYTNFGLKF